MPKIAAFFFPQKFPHAFFLGYILKSSITLKILKRVGFVSHGNIYEPFWFNTIEDSITSQHANYQQ